ncbi:NOL1/NOP2/sun family putative RNA methylase [Candidatus Woesearchaeota archaeon]|nr:NOL1/NOP2/sun family putative RNA methylase [Candidatus Woesearchaeota archaeon]
MYEWKEKFKERYKGLTDLDTFLEAAVKPLRKSVRVNTLKISVQEMKKRMRLEQIPWCREGFWVDGYALGNTLEHFLGYIYLQGTCSMIPPVVLDPKAGELVLDLCASPGSKTSQMAAMMKNEGLIVANDNRIDRLKPLTINLQRCGVMNTVLTLMEGRWFKDYSFDKILVDAPCSGIGTISKSPKTIQIWNPNFSKKMAGIQKQLLTTAFESLKENGVVVYSTCTLEPEENEGVISSLLEKYDSAKLEKIDLDIKHGDAVEEFEGKTYSQEIKKCLRIWPQDNNTEGFFVAKIRKNG